MSCMRSGSTDSHVTYSPEHAERAELAENNTQKILCVLCDLFRDRGVTGAATTPVASKVRTGRVGYDSEMPGSFPVESPM